MTDRKDLDLKEVRAALEQERAEILAASTAHADDRKPVELDQQSVGRLSRMDAMQVQAMAKAQETRRQGRLVALAAALARLADGDYGICVQCGEDVPAKRLAVDAATVRCMDCMN